MSYNYGSNYPNYNTAASSGISPSEYSQASRQREASDSSSLSHGQADKRGNTESRRNTVKSSSSRNRSRTPEKSYRSGRSSRRSRSRSRSSSRHQRRRSKSRSRSRERSTKRRSRSPRYDRSPRPTVRRSPLESVNACSKVILISLPVNIDKDVINIMIAKQGFHPIDIRIVRKTTDCGAVRVFGFVEFSDSIQAQAWINYNKGHLVFDDGHMVKLEFSREIDSERRERGNGVNAATPSSDWTCSKCTINNFNRRNNCFKCGTSRQDSEALEAKGFSFVGVSPCDTLLMRELPASATEESVRKAMSQYTNHAIQRMQIAPSKSYALLQMKSLEDAVYVLNTFNKMVPYVDNCAVIVTFSRQSLNQILIMDNVNILKSQSGITSVNIHQDPTNSAALLAQNAMQMVQMGRQNIPLQLQHHDGNPTRQSISTPFGYLQSYSTPNHKSFQWEPVSGYYYDADTAFYFDSKTEYYYNQKTNSWMFWCSKYSTYIPCEGGDLELKKRLQQEEKDDQRIRNSAVISAPPALASNSAVSSVTPEQLTSSSTQDDDSEVQIIGETVKHSVPASTKIEESGDEPEALKSKKKRRKDEPEDPNKPKSAQDIQREMAKWARRQEVKMTFKQQEISSAAPAARKSLTGDITPHLIDKLKKPWGDDEADDENPKIPDSALTSRMRNVGLPLNYQSRTAASRTEHNEYRGEMQDPDESSASGGGQYASDQIFDEEKFLDRIKPTCLLCRRQFASLEILNKHVQLSDLHKTNVAAKIKELQQTKIPISSSCKINEPAYRDRAKERRKIHGYDPSGLTGPNAEVTEIDVKSTEAIAAFKAIVPLDESNIGNKMLKSMGWSEGQGLGRNLQGIINPVTADQRVQGVGLGASGSKLDFGGSRKDRLKQAAIQRFNDITEKE